MPKATRGRGATQAPVARRMRADARKRSILKAARKAFSETGDLNGTTIKIIAQHAEISEGVIYRHFESKDQLFFEAAVEPLRGSGRQPRRGPRDHRPGRADHARAPAREFERSPPSAHFDPQGSRSPSGSGTLRRSQDRPPLLQRELRRRHGPSRRRVAPGGESLRTKFVAPDITALGSHGNPLVLALESYYNKNYDLDRAIAIASDGCITRLLPTRAATKVPSLSRKPNARSPPASTVGRSTTKQLNAHPVTLPTHRTVR